MSSQIVISYFVSRLYFIFNAAKIRFKIIFSPLKIPTPMKNLPPPEQQKKSHISPKILPKSYVYIIKNPPKM